MSNRYVIYLKPDVILSINYISILSLDNCRNSLVAQHVKYPVLVASVDLSLAWELLHAAGVVKKNTLDNCTMIIHIVLTFGRAVWGVSGNSLQFFFFFNFLQVHNYFRILFLFLHFKAKPAAYGSSQIRGRILTTAVRLHPQPQPHRSEKPVQPTPQLRARQDPGPLSEARDQTRVFMDTSRIRFTSTTKGTHISNF